MTPPNDDGSTDRYWPASEPPRFETTVDPPPPRPIRFYVACVAAVALLLVSQWLRDGHISSPLVATLLLVVFAIVGYRSTVQRPVRYALRFFERGVEVDTPKLGFVSVSWDRVGRVQLFTTGAANLWTDDGAHLATMPAGSFKALMETGIVPASVPIHQPKPVEDAAAAKSRWRKTLVLWLLLMVLFVVIYSLVSQ